MDQIIKKIKKDLQPLKKQYNLRLKYYRNNYQEVLEYTNYYGLNFKKHNLVCKFILQKQENSLTLNYKYICTKRNCDVIEAYSFLDNLTQDYPGFKTEDVLRIKELYSFEIVDNVITNQIPLENQSEVIVDAFLNNYSTLTELVKSQTN